MQRRTAVPGNLGGRVLTWQFGPQEEGLAYYLVIEHARQVALLEVQCSTDRDGQFFPTAEPLAPKAVPDRPSTSMIC